MQNIDLKKVRNTIKNVEASFNSFLINENNYLLQDGSLHGKMPNIYNTRLNNFIRQDRCGTRVTCFRITTWRMKLIGLDIFTFSISITDYH